MRLFLSRGVLFFVLLCWTTQTSAQILPRYTDVNYVGDSLDRHRLDVYIPTGLQGPRPAVVYIHGGGWANGEKKGDLRHDLTRLYQYKKYVIVDINYRYSQDSIWPAQLYDCKAAIRHLRHHAETYNIDTCAIGVMGHSAGGHLAAMLGTTNHTDSLEGYHLGHMEYSSNVQAVVDFFGPTDFLKADDYFPIAPPDSCAEVAVYATPYSMTSQLLGCPINTCPERVQSANPITYVDGNEPPFRIYHGTFDCAVPLHQSQILYESLMLEDISTDFIVVENAVHADHVFYANPAVIALTDFFVEHLSAAACFLTPTDTISKAEFNIYPNPASDFLSIDLNDNAPPLSIEIINSTGKTIGHYDDTTIDIQALSKGIYLIHLKFPKESITQKFIKM